MNMEVKMLKEIIKKELEEIFGDLTIREEKIIEETIKLTLKNG
jgi:hypothetical protein